MAISFWMVFVPMGFFHYFENIGEDDLQFLISFNNSEAESDDDIGVSVSLGGVPNHVLAATFGVPEKVFDQVPKLHKEVAIVKGRSDVLPLSIPARRESRDP